MKYSIKLLVMLIMLSLMAISGPLTVVAQTETPDTSTVWTTGVDDPDAPWKSIFVIGETVYIFYTVNPVGPVDIYIEDAAYNKLYTVVLGTTAGKAQWVVPDELEDDVQIQLFVAAYKADGTVERRVFSTCTITITVVPEATMGAIGLIAAAFTGFGLVYYRKNKFN